MITKVKKYWVVVAPPGTRPGQVAGLVCGVTDAPGAKSVDWINAGLGFRPTISVLAQGGRLVDGAGRNPVGAVTVRV